MAGEQIVYVIRNGLEQPCEISKLVNKYHQAQEIDILDARIHDFMDAMMIVVDIKLEGHEIITHIKEVMNNPTLLGTPSLFILSEMNRREIIQSTALGATDFITHPIKEEVFAKALGKIANEHIENMWGNLNKTQEAALKVSLKVFEDTFKHVREGKPFSQEDVREGCDLIIEATAEEGIVGWMDAVKEHHNQTYRHSMMVCGFLVSFGMILGVRGSDLQRLSICGLVHDIGKAFIPLNVLDKPGLLTDDDWIIMRSHPEYTRKIMIDSDCDPDVLDGAIHHHEKIDGTGYPDGLSGDDVSDFARMVAVADVFSGLTEKRAYKASMPALEAFEIMMGMDGHLDLDLVKAFEPVVLDMVK